MGGDRGEQPGELGVLAHVGLAEEDAALGVEAGGEQDRGRVVDALAQLGRVVGDRDRVQVDDAVDRRVAAVLALDVLADRADVVAEVLAAGRLDAAEDRSVRACGETLCRAGRGRSRSAARRRSAGVRSRQRGRTRRRSRRAAARRHCLDPALAGCSIPMPATMPPTIISTPPIADPEVEGRGRGVGRRPSSTRSASGGREAARSSGTAERLVLGVRRPPSAAGRDERSPAELVVERRAEAGPRSRRRGRRSPAARRPGRRRC